MWDKNNQRGMGMKKIDIGETILTATIVWAILMMAGYLTEFDIARIFA